MTTLSLRAILSSLLIGGLAMAQEVSPEPQATPTPAASPAPAAPPASTTPAATSEATPVAPAAPGPEAKPATDTKAPQASAPARLVCYREKKFVGSGLHHTIYLDDVEIADLNNGTYFVIKATPGEHKMHADEKKDEFTFTVEAGKTYYFKTELQMGFWKGHGKVAPVEASFATREFEEWKKGKLKYSPDLKKTDALEMP